MPRRAEILGHGRGVLVDGDGGGHNGEPGLLTHGEDSHKDLTVVGHEEGAAEPCGHEGQGLRGGSAGRGAARGLLLLLMMRGQKDLSGGWRSPGWRSRRRRRGRTP